MKFFIFISSILLALIPLTTHAVALAPSVLEISASRGAVVSREIRVINATGMEQSYFLGVLKFAPSEDGGSPQFISYEVDHSGLPDWIVLPFTEFRVPANAKASVPFEIAVPNDVASGGYYAAITVSQAPSDVVADNGAIIEAKTAALLLFTVEGETVEKVELLDFVMDGSLLRSSLGATFAFRLQNQGNVHVLPAGTVKVTDVLGREVLRMDANPEQGRVLPASTRRFEVTGVQADGLMDVLKSQMQTLAIGPISAQLDLTYGAGEQKIHSELTFWYIPWQLILTVVAFVGIFWKLLTRATTKPVIRPV